jgi:hypothetical protein
MFRSKYFVLDTTGPGLVSRTLAEYSGACEQVKVLFPEDVRDPASWYCFGNYGVHLQHGAWRKPDRTLYRVMHRYWETKTRKTLLKESVKRGAKRSLKFKGSMAPHPEVPQAGGSWRSGVASTARNADPA